MRRGAWDDYVSPDRTAYPRLEPIFGCRSYTPLTICQDIHPHGKIPKGSKCCCMAPGCYQSGVDHLTLPGSIGEPTRPEYLIVQPTVYTPEAEKPKPGKRPKQLKQARRSTPRAEDAQ